VADAGEGAVEELSAAFGGRHPEVIVETVGGHANTLDQAITLAKAGGRVSILGIFSQQVTINATVTALKEISLVGGITYGRPGALSDFEVALAIAAGHADELRTLITHRIALSDIERGFATAADKSQRSIKVTVEM
jgi:threonine dehydrogenase-like Zn-dependent dehydrogenase